MSENKTKEALNEIKELVTKHKDILPDRVRDVLGYVEDGLLRIELGSILDAKIPEYVSLSSGCADLYGNKYLIKFAEGGSANITWPDDGKQPLPGWYLRFSFSSGAYIFGGDYPVKSFNGFFEELKSFGATHSDTNNNSLYFSLERSPEAARQAYAQYQGIYEKWYKEAKKEVLNARIAKAEEELNKLRSGV